MDIFYIDRQFGAAIFVEVENGIVTKVYGESDRYNARMMEEYKGKTIEHLKTHFEARMKGTYHNVRSLDIVTANNVVEALKSHVAQVAALMSDNRNNKGRNDELRERWNALIVEQSAAEAELNTVRSRIQTEHGYTFKF
jgi:hypothetical protein